ncbi:MAG: FAD-dependent oxidoreductase [Thermoplasmata archaeon]|nr:NAD(P)-binding protein [Thermoplasmatales archaeon]
MPETLIYRLNFKRVPIKSAPPDQRKKDFKMQVTLGYSKAEAMREASRCMGCGLCIQGCPARLDIPGYVQAIARGEFEKSLRIIMRDLPFPEICGNICTHNCEDNCVYKEPVAIRHLKRFVAEQFPDYSKVLEHKRREKTGRKVAIIGAGPAGLTVAYYLTMFGVECTVYDALPVPLGMLNVGIPKYRLPMKVLEKEYNFIKNAGVRFFFNTRVGKDIPFQDIMKGYDAIFLGIGNMKGNMTGTPGSDGKYVYHALDFLRKANLGEEIPMGKKVAIIGGGFTAMDSARTALRLGAEKVYVLYRRRAEDRPGYPSGNAEEEMEETVEEGVEFLWKITPIEYVKDSNGMIRGIRYWKNEMVSDGSGGRLKPVPIKDVEFFIEVDTIIEATGQSTDISFLPPEISKSLKMKGNEILVDENGMTSVPGIFAGGDSTNSTKDFISAVADGNRAVKGILRYLKIDFTTLEKVECNKMSQVVKESTGKDVKCNDYIEI